MTIACEVLVAIMVYCCQSLVSDLSVHAAARATVTGVVKRSSALHVMWLQVRWLVPCLQRIDNTSIVIMIQIMFQSLSNTKHKRLFQTRPCVDDNVLNHTTFGYDACRRQCRDQTQPAVVSAWLVVANEVSCMHLRHATRTMSCSIRPV